ncbi:DMT family transporter [Rubellimicrobium arenae]|uniref:DMT family transporter n=1 Tax=Rubellimicrobium arenae TaxID=2817372 RepID=UPI001B30E1AA|nr:DMT family transporter [Rubellimicrobium arenae]
MTARPLPSGTAPAEARPLPGARLPGNLLAMGSMVVWAAGFPAAEGLLSDWEPLALVPARLAMGLLLLLPVWLALEGWPRGVPWGRCFLIGTIGIGGAAVAAIFAQAATDPVTVAVIASIAPLSATLVEWIYERRPLTRAFLLGLAATIAGGVIATMGGGAGQGNLWLGAVLAVSSSLVYSWGSYMTVRQLPTLSGLGQTTATLTGACVAMTALVALATALGWTALPADPFRASDLGLLAVYGMGALALSQLLFILSIHRLGVAIASFHMNLAPFYVMLILIALGGQWSWMQAAGAAVVAAGVLLAQR